MNKMLAFGLTAAAVVTLVVGAQSFGPTGIGGVGTEPSPTPVPSGLIGKPSPSPVWAGLDEGPLRLWRGITVTIPAPGWSLDTIGNLGKNGNGSAPDGAFLHGPFKGEVYVPGDPCQWRTTMPDIPTTTVGEVVAALSRHASREASAPVDITIDGLPATAITLHVPDDIEIDPGDLLPTGCDEGVYCGFALGDATSCFHTLYQPGQVVDMRIVEIEGLVAIIEGAYYAATPAEHVDELRAILASITFERVDGAILQ